MNTKIEDHETHEYENTKIMKTMKSTQEIHETTKFENENVWKSVSCMKCVFIRLKIQFWRHIENQDLIQRY